MQSKSDQNSLAQLFILLMLFSMPCIIIGMLNIICTSEIETQLCLHLYLRQGLPYVADSMSQEHYDLAAELTLCPAFNTLFTLYASTCQAEFVLTNISKGSESNCLLIKSADMAAVISSRYGCQWNIFACCC